LYAKIFTDFE